MLSEIKRGDVFYANLKHNESETSIQTGVRPVIIVQNDVGNAYSPTTIVVPLTSKKKKRYMPTHVLISANQDNGLRTDSIALLEQVQPVDKKCLKERLGCLRDMKEIDKALKVSVGLA